MPAQSQQQQKLFGLALSVKRGDTPRSEASKEVLKIVDTMTEKEIEDFAGTEHEGLPKKVEQKIREMARQTIREQMMGEAKFNRGDMVRVIDNPKYVMDKKKFAGKSGYVKNIMGSDVMVKFPNGRTILVDPKDLEMNPNESVNEGIGTIALGVAGGLLLLKVLKFVLKKVVGTIGMNVSLPKEKLLEVVDSMVKNVLQQSSGKKINMLQLVALQSFLKDEINAGKITTVKQIMQVINKASKIQPKDESVNEEIKVGSSVIVNYPTLKKPIKGKVKHILKSPKGLVYVLDGDKGVWDDKYLSKNESVNEEIKVGSSVIVNYPTLKKPIKGKVKHILKSPKGLVYVLDGDKGVWDAKTVSLKESVNEGDTLKQVKRGNSIILKKGNKIYATISQNPNKEFNWTVYFKKGGALSGYKTKEDAIARAQKMSDSFKSAINKIKGESVNEANGEFVVYVEKDNGRKKLLHTKKSQRAANMFMSKNMDKILNKSGIRSIGSMSKDQWEKKEAQFAENIKKKDMKTVTKKEWDRTHKDYKGMIKGQPYMMWFDKQTQSTVYGPVHIKD